MSEEINGQVNLPAVADQGDRPQRVPIMSGAAPRAIVPVDFDGAYRIANVVVRAGMAPKSIDTVEKCMVAIMHGMEVGLTPMNAIQTIAVINGKPTIYGDGAVGLVLGSGLCEGIEEFYEGKEGTDSFKAVCIAKRKGHKPVRGEFSIEDAKVAGLWTKRGRNGEPTPWQTYPKRMLKWRARWALRDAFADVLKGLALREEVEDMIRLQEPTPAEDATPRKRAPAPPEETAAQSTGTTAAEPSEGHENPAPRRAPPPPDEETFDGPRWITELENAYSGCEDFASLAEEQRKRMLSRKGEVTETLWASAMDVTQRHFARISAA